MQTDTWLTDTTHPDCCPLCSQPLAAGSNVCPSCGFTAHEPARGSSAQARTPLARQPNPVTPIPARASARRPQEVHGGTSFRSPSSSTQPAPFSDLSTAESARGRRHDSASYEAVSSLSSLSLIISETPTAPPRATSRLPRQSRRLEHIDEIDTVPQKSGSRAGELEDAEAPISPGSLSLRFDEIEVPGLALVRSEATPPARLTNIDEIDTVPESGQGTSRALQLITPGNRIAPVDAASWTASPRSTTSLAARFIASRTPVRTRRTHRFSPLDHTRWWLLRPGHIEFLLWLTGSMLLFGITFLLLLSIVLSVMLPGAQARGNFPRSNSSGAATPAVTAGPRLNLAGPNRLASGAELHLQGQGFRPLSQVTFWLDGRWSLLDQHGRPASTKADATGHFTASLWLGQGTNWSAGPHQILAREMDNGHQAVVSITITPGPTTPESNAPGPRSTPVPPARPTPTPPTPAPTPAQPTPTPVQPTPTAGITPTVSPSKTPTGSPTASDGKAMNSTSLGNDLNTSDGNSLFARLLHLNPLIWLIGICYLLSMLFMGIAGVLRRRRR